MAFMDRKITAAEWNLTCPIGTRVIYNSKETKTRSEAWELGHGEPVVLIDGRTGGVALWALTVVQETTQFNTRSPER